MASTVAVARIAFILTGLLLFAGRAGAQDSRPSGAGGASESAPEGGGPPEDPRTITVAKLIAEMADLSALTRLPETPWRLESFSSALLPATRSGGVEPGFARRERRGERHENVLLDVQGPGALVRLWVSRSLGTLRAFVDGSPIPAIEMPVELVTSGQITAFSGPFAAKLGQGGVLRFPIPYQTSLKLTCDAGGFDWEADVRTYPAGTSGESFVMKEAVIQTFMAAGEIARLRAPASALALESVTDGSLTKVTGTGPAIEVEPGSSAVVLERATAEPQALVHFGAVEMAPAHVAATAGETLFLRIDVDGQTTADVPLRVFLGGALPEERGSTYPLGAEGDVFLEHRVSWPMPFRRSLRISLANRGAARSAPWMFRARTEPIAAPRARSPSTLFGSRRAPARARSPVPDGSSAKPWRPVRRPPDRLRLAFRRPPTAYP
jgi:hypothetical protein